MDSQDVQIALKRIHADLNRIYQSRGFLHILNQTQEPTFLDNSLGSALYFVTESHLRVNRILEAQKYKESA